MTELTISKLNDVYLRINADESILHELGNYFCFEVPGHRFMKAFKEKLWDGKIRLFSYKTNLIYAGLYYHILDFAKRSAYTISADSYVPEIEDISFENIQKYVTEVIDPYSKGQKIEVRDYQLNAIYHCLTRGRAVIESPTSSGKSLIIYSVVRYLLAAKKVNRVLFVFPTTALVSQMASDFQDYSSNNKWDVVNRSHLIYAGQEKQTDKVLTFSTYQSLTKMPVSFYKQFDCVIVDEVHTAKSKSITDILEKCHNIPYRFGFTGTLNEGKAHALQVQGMFGKAYATITTAKLMERAEVSDLTIKCVILKYPQNICEIIKETEYAEEINYICLHAPRNNFIKNLVNALSGNTLILFNFIEQGKILYDLLKDKGNVHFVHGKISVEKREAIRQIAESTNDAIIIASYGVYSTGVNIRNLQNGVFASPSKSRIRVLQSLGRIIRLNGAGSTCTLYDIADNMSYLSKKNLTLTHFEERVRYYAEGKLKYKIIEHNLKH